MGSYYVLNVDMKGSSDAELSSEQTSHVWTVAENLLRFVASNEDVPDDRCLWAGDGGYVILDDGSGAAGRIYRIADWFTACADHYLNPTYLRIESFGQQQFRACIARVEAFMPATGRLSNLAGWALSLLLKYERDFGVPGHISIWDTVYKELDKGERARFQKRDVQVHGITVYDAPVRKRSPFLETLILRSKDEIDRTTVGYLFDGLAQLRKLRDEQKTKQPAGDSAVAAQLEERQFREVVKEALNPPELYVEILKAVAQCLMKQHPGVSFRVAYAQHRGDQLHIEHVALRDTNDRYHHIPLDGDGRFSARIAFDDKQFVNVPSTKDEINKKEKTKRRFERTYEKQDLSRLASLLCIPVISRSRSVDTPQELVHGVVCIDCAVNGFFSDTVAAPLVDALESFITELSLAEMIDGLLSMFVDDKASKQRKSEG